MKIPVLPLRNMVLFPGVLLPVTVARPKSQRLVKNAFEQEKLLAVLCQKDRDKQEPKGEDLYNLGTAARVVRVLDLPDSSQMVILDFLLLCHRFLPTILFQGVAWFRNVLQKRLLLRLQLE